ncbi:MAG: GIY-YIG nuclease family protein [Gammaproteobacteria bacterium]
MAEITTRTVQVFDIPRSQLSAFQEQPAAGQVAVYYLFGDEHEDALTQCYIGQTGVVGRRLQEHLQGKAFWTRALVAVSRTNTQTETHARFLEWKSIKASHESGRYRIENGNTGSLPHTPAPLEAECEEIFETIDTLLSTLGYPLFEPLPTSAPRPSDIRVFCKGRGGNAEAIYRDGEITIVQGSRCAESPLQSATDWARSTRQRLMDDGSLVIEDGKAVFTRDIPFRSPSGASAVVLFRSSNGWAEWRTADGTTLNDATGRSRSETNENEASL